MTNKSAPVIPAFPWDETDPFRRTLIGTVVRYEIGRLIFCPYSGALLDIRTAGVLLTTDGDVLYVMSPNHLRAVLASETSARGLLRARPTLRTLFMDEVK